jgi:hypothetical protein
MRFNLGSIVVNLYFDARTDPLEKGTIPCIPTFDIMKYAHGMRWSHWFWDRQRPALGFNIGNHSSRAGMSLSCQRRAYLILSEGPQFVCKYQNQLVSRSCEISLAIVRKLSSNCELLLAL